MNIIIRRLLAFCADYILILLYGALLFLITQGLKIEIISNLQAQLLGFFSLTVPVFLYFFLSESRKRKATLGKRLLKINVETTSKSRKASVFKRNFFKFLPWEIAHFDVHWVFYYSSNEIDIPIWVWILLILPQIIVIVYIISIFFSKGKSSVYDKIGGTQVN